MHTRSLGTVKAILACIGDGIAYASALILMLVIRYGTAGFSDALALHKGPFLLLVPAWFVVFYIADLYNYASWRTTVDNLRRFSIAVAMNFFVAIGLFYAFGNVFRLTPKFNLVLFTAIFFVFDAAWRYTLARLLAARSDTRDIILITRSPLAEAIIQHTEAHPQLGYHIHRVETLAGANLQRSARPMIVADRAALKDPETAQALYDLLLEHAEIVTLSDFYQMLFGRVPLSELEDEWFISEIKSDRSWYDFGKRTLDVVFSLFGIIILSPVFLVLFILIPLTSEGPAIYKQKRVGKDGKLFTIYKFRNMYQSKEKNPDSEGTAPMWWQENDPRVTRLGAFLRASHLDELPQLFNILFGTMSLVGPRPERPEFTKDLEAELPYYMMRTMVMPGLTGWAQLKFRYAGTMNEWQQKFEYDLYYIRHRGFFFDVGIIAKTIRRFMPGRRD